MSWSLTHFESSKSFQGKIDYYLLIFKIKKPGNQDSILLSVLM